MLGTRLSDGRLDRQINSVEWLRAIAATLVVLFHTTQGIEFRTGYIITDPTNFGACGVDIFFVISGFIMTVTTHGRAFDWKTFLAKRVIRLMPIYWALTLLKAASMLLLPSLVLFSVVSVPNLVASLLMLPRNTGHGVVPLIIVGWSLELEILFYVAFAVCKQMFPSRWVAALTTFFLAINVVYLFSPTCDFVDFYARPVVFEFLFGVGVALLCLRGWFPGRRLAWAMIAASSLVFLTVPTGSESTRFVLWGLPAFAMVWAAVSLERQYEFWRWRPVVYIGNASYSLYLTHTLTVPLLMFPLKFFQPSVAGAYLYLVPVMVLQVAIGCATYWLLEKPLNGWCQARYRQWQRGALPDAAVPSRGRP